MRSSQVKVTLDLIVRSEKSHQTTMSSTIAPSLAAADLFTVKGLVAVITGGGTGEDSTRGVED